MILPLVNPPFAVTCIDGVGGNQNTILPSSVGDKYAVDH